MSIASNIRNLREDRGLSQADLASIVGVTFQAISAWETGVRTPRMGAIQKIADYFGIPKSRIIEDPAEVQVAEVAEKIEQEPIKTAISLADVILDANTRHMMARYNTMTHEKQRQVQDFVSFLSQDER